MADETLEIVRVIGKKSEGNPTGITIINKADHDQDVHGPVVDENGKPIPVAKPIYTTMSNAALKALLAERKVPEADYAEVDRGELLRLAKESEAV